MITLGGGAHPAPIVVEPLRWTHSGRVQVRERRVGADGRTVRGAFYPVEVFALAHSDGRHALTRALAQLPKEGE